MHELTNILKAFSEASHDIRNSEGETVPILKIDSIVSFFYLRNTGKFVCV